MVIRCRVYELSLKRRSGILVLVHDVDKDDTELSV